MNYTDTLDFLYSRIKFGIRPGLETTQTLLGRLGNPHHRFKSVLIAGTNGKGSTAAMLHSILVESGYKAGLYTSPHLFDFRERIRVNHEMISEKDVIEGVKKIGSVTRELQPTFFEWVTVLAFLEFARTGVEIAVLETGLGGRLDATNVVRPEVSVITPISLDHTKFLGESVEDIALEKGGIVRDGGVLVTLAEEEKVLKIFQKICSDRKAEILEISREIDAQVFSMNLTGSFFNLAFKNSMLEGIKVPLAGRHQVKNATLAIASGYKLRKAGLTGISENSIMRGMEKTVWRGRLDTVSVSPKVVLDAAHNPGAARVLVSELQELFEFSGIIFVLGMMKDKDISLTINELCEIADGAIVVQPHSERAENPEKTANYFQEKGIKSRVIPDISTAIFEAKKEVGKEGLVCVTGSIFTVAEAFRGLEIRA